MTAGCTGGGADEPVTFISQDRLRQPMDRRTLLTTVSAGGALLAGCIARGNRSDPGGGTGTGTSLAITSPAFERGDPIPRRYACDGDGVSPELTLSGPVPKMKSFALVVDDPDAPREEPFVHWLLWNVPADTETLPVGVERGDHPESVTGVQGTNDAGTVGYTGPCPPRGDDPHTYRFHLFGLDAELDLTAGAGRDALEDAMSGHVVDDATFTGTYQRA